MSAASLVAILQTLSHVDSPGRPAASRSTECLCESVCKRERETYIDCVLCNEYN